jgi:Flp pilus assembly protein TadG
MREPEWRLPVSANTWRAAGRESTRRRRAPCVLGAEGIDPSLTERGQGMVEFALVASVLLFLAIGAIQFALIFNAVLSVSQLSYAGARYASVNSGMSSGSVSSYMKTTLASPTINESSGANITVNLLNSGGATIGSVPSSGTQFAVQVTYDLSASKIFLPATFFGYSLHLPTSVTNQTAVMAE